MHCVCLERREASTSILVIIITIIIIIITTTTTITTTATPLKSRAPSAPFSADAVPMDVVGLYDLSLSAAIDRASTSTSTSGSGSPTATGTSRAPPPPQLVGEVELQEDGSKVCEEKEEDGEDDDDDDDGEEQEQEDGYQDHDDHDEDHVDHRVWPWRPGQVVTIRSCVSLHNKSGVPVQVRLLLVNQILSSGVVLVDGEMIPTIYEYQVVAAVLVYRWQVHG
jgi:hypothetical protein